MVRPGNVGVANRLESRAIAMLEQRLQIPAHRMIAKIARQPADAQWAARIVWIDSWRQWRRSARSNGGTETPMLGGPRRFVEPRIVECGEQAVALCQHVVW